MLSNIFIEFLTRSVVVYRPTLFLLLPWKLSLFHFLWVTIKPLNFLALFSLPSHEFCLFSAVSSLHALVTCTSLLLLPIFSLFGYSLCCYCCGCLNRGIFCSVQPCSTLQLFLFLFRLAASLVTFSCSCLLLYLVGFSWLLLHWFPAEHHRHHQLFFFLVRQDLFQVGDERFLAS